MATGLRVLLSVVAASGIVLGAVLVLAWLSDVKPSDEAPIPRTLSQREARLSGVLNDERRAMCQTWEESVREVINSSRACFDTSQCTLVRLDCPFGCESAVNTEHVLRVEAAARDYPSSTCVDCMYGCRPGLPIPQCVDSQCAVIYVSQERPELLQHPELPQYDPASQPTGTELD